MSTATAAPAADAAPAPKGKKKLFIIIGVAVLVLALAGGGAVFYLKSKAAAEAAAAEEDEGGSAAQAKAETKKDPKAVPTFVPLDPFTVNLADRDAERYAQVGVSLELADPKEADRVKNYMPAIRNNILMVLSHKTSAELLERDGKTKLAQEIRRETAKALGIEVEDDEPEDPPKKAEADSEDEDKPVKKKKKKKVEQVLPVAAVHFSNFIIQ
jgi:flagellar protein FliL